MARKGEGGRGEGVKTRVPRARARTRAIVLLDRGIVVGLFTRGR